MPRGRRRKCIELGCGRPTLYRWGLYCGDPGCLENRNNENLDRDKFDNFKAYMENHPIYFQDIFGTQMSIEDAWEASRNF